MASKMWAAKSIDMLTGSAEGRCINLIDASVGSLRGVCACASNISHHDVFNMALF